MAEETELALVVYRLDDISNKVDDLIVAVKGNGKPGMVLNVERLRAEVAECNRQIAESNARREEAIRSQGELKKEIAAINDGIQQRKLDDARFKSRLKGVGIGAALVGMGGGGGLTLFFTQLLGG